MKEIQAGRAEPYSANKWKVKIRYDLANRKVFRALEKEAAVVLDTFASTSTDTYPWQQLTPLSVD